MMCSLHLHTPISRQKVVSKGAVVIGAETWLGFGCQVMSGVKIGRHCIIAAGAIVVNAEGSDSAMLDNTLEFLVMNGMDLPLAVMITIPEPWMNNKGIHPAKKDFYQYYATMMEPWDGPASIIFSDGDMMGAVLDRNGLRPSRYYITKDGFLVLSSEVGCIDIPAEDVVVKERLRPGKMLHLGWQ